MTISSTTGLYLEKQNVKPLSKGNTLYVGGSGPNNYTKIQDAIDNATDGDTVFVYNGTYGLTPYSINIYKSINLIGENKFNTIINDSWLRVNVSEVLISGFTLQNNSAIQVTSFQNINNITITDNILDNYYSGIMMLIFSNNNTITNNTFFNCGLTLWGYNNLVYNNTVNGKPLVYLESTSDRVIDYAGQVILIDCSNVSINNIELSKVDFGIQLYECTNCYIKSNVLSSSAMGIFLVNSTSNTISGNIFINNLIGLLFTFGENNNISGNHFEKGMLNVALISSNNNLFSKNNFIFNHTILLYLVRKNIFSIDSDNKWEGNYWNRARLLPVLIWGNKLIKLFIYRNIPWLDIDWHPAKEPYEIGEKDRYEETTRVWSDSSFPWTCYRTIY
jgi:parallel beta-helix repeat protein